jgi:uncharacterized protein YceH (UPF0502 family)
VEPLDEFEARILGALVEKQRTVPDTYPLTLNALVAACNQTSNRDPVVSWSDGDVQRTLDGLKARGLVRFVHPSHGRSVTRYRQVLDEVEGFDPTEVAALAVLLLRGPQTLNEVRTRTERYSEIGDVAEALERLAARDLAERRPGAREPRWVDTITPWRIDLGHSAAHTAVERPKSGLEERVAALEAEVAELRDVVAQLRTLLD